MTVVAWPGLLQSNSKISFVIEIQTYLSFKLFLGT